MVQGAFLQASRSWTPELRSRDPCEKNWHVLHAMFKEVSYCIDCECVHTRVDKYGRLLVDLSTEKYENVSSYILSQDSLWNT